MITMGVEEEYLLVDPVSGLPAPLSDEVRAAAGLGPMVQGREVQPELLQAQVEVATPICETLDEVGGHLLRLRHAVGIAAEQLGCRLAASAAAPLAAEAPAAVTCQPRYQALHARAPQIVNELLINGMHVHVAMPDREVGVAVLNRIRVWLPTLLAMSANSPLWRGRDTGFASWRTPVFSRWPVYGPPPVFADLKDYERRTGALLASGVIADTGQLYWQARLSERYPTLEVRCLDVQLRADDAVMFAGIVRALAATALREYKDGEPEPECAPELLQAAMWHAARHGLSGTLIDPTGLPRSAGDTLCLLTGHIAAALEASGDSREVGALVHRLRRQGNGADRQRQALAQAGMPALLDLITTEAIAP
ncbi:glutamate--cysteine ligase [Streptomyces sp. NPDC050485]|uniref:glutamate--cysteine ligase n=1 Tax=Streptomyces sp. NPDC050485 TaxID=3365617 RepID=UPI00379FE61F